MEKTASNKLPPESEEPEGQDNIDVKGSEKEKLTELKLYSETLRNLLKE